MEFLNPLDTSFVALEREDLPMHIGGVAILEGPAPTHDELLQLLEARLDRLPRYRQVIVPVPMHVGPPAWLDDPDFDLLYHVRHTALPQPGSDDQLRTLASRVQSQRLDPKRPPWELWLVEGLTGDRFAIINKVHHAMVDGKASADLLEVLLDPSPDTPAGEPTPWHPEPWPSPTSRVTAALGEGVRQPAARVKDVAGHLSTPTGAVKRSVASAAGQIHLGRQMSNAEKRLLGKPGRSRRWTWAEGDLAAVKAIKRQLGGTVNDVILTAVSGGFRAYLLDTGERLTDEDTVRSMVPVSTRDPRDPAQGGNAVAMMLVDLPVGVADPVERLARVGERMKILKTSGQVQGTNSLVANAALIPPLLFAAAGKLAAQAPQSSVATITTNVPGAQHQLYLLGRPLTRVLPFVPLGMNQLITVAIVSYNGHIDCGITGDFDGVVDLGPMSEGIEADLATLADKAVQAASAGS